MQSDGNTEIQPGWSVDDVLVKDFVPCPAHRFLTAEAPFTPKRTAVSSRVVPRVGPVPARAAKVTLDADVVSSAIPAAIGNAAARRAGSAVCVSVAGIKIRPIGSPRHPDQLPATGVGDGGFGSMAVIAAAMALWLWRRRIA
jgi:hypothetical protein